MKLSLIIPIYNEEQNLPQLLAKVDSFDFGIPKEIVLIDDKSHDRSLELISSFPFVSEHLVLLHQVNQGKGAALRTGISASSGEIVAIQDADFEYQLEDLKTLLPPLMNDEADVIYGSRFRKEHYQVHRTFHYLGNRFLTFLSNLCSGMYLSDMETCYKVFRGEIIRNIILKNNRFGFEPEITAKLARLNLRVQERPISYFPRNYLQGKKITWKDGVAAIWHILYFNLLETSNDQSFLLGMPAKYLLTAKRWL